MLRFERSRVTTWHEGRAPGLETAPLPLSSWIEVARRDARRIDRSVSFDLMLDSEDGGQHLLCTVGDRALAEGVAALVNSFLEHTAAVRLARGNPAAIGGGPHPTGPTTARAPRAPSSDREQIRTHLLVLGIAYGSLAFALTRHASLPHWSSALLHELMAWLTAAVLGTVGMTSSLRQMRRLDGLRLRFVWVPSRVALAALYLPLALLLPGVVFLFLWLG